MRHAHKNMSSHRKDDTLKEVLPKNGMVFTEETTQMVLTKPKILPLKSVTLEKIEQMQKQAQEQLKQMAPEPSSNIQEQQQIIQE